MIAFGAHCVALGAGEADRDDSHGPRLAQVTSEQVGALEIGADHPRAVEDRGRQVGIGQVAARKIQPGQ
eukprot:gene41329-55900_t